MILHTTPDRIAALDDQDVATLAVVLEQIYGD